MPLEVGIRQLPMFISILSTWLRSALLIVAVIGFTVSANAQRVAILVPQPTAQGTQFSERLAPALEKRFRIIDSQLAEAAYRSRKIETPFNLTSDAARNIASVIGCDLFVILKADTLRRSSSARPSYFESFASAYFINGRTGRLLQWRLESKTGTTAAEAEIQLMANAQNAADELILAFDASTKPDQASANFDFEAFDLDAKGLRPPMPYKRIKPTYTQTAYFYEVAATVDAEVSIDANGDVKRIDLVRWAGYGLDESAIEAIRTMNWRPGEKNGKPLPMRVLLRYNFTKIEKDWPIRF